jgi:hypothetical protein
MFVVQHRDEQLTNVAPVLCSRDVSVHPESSVDAPNLFACNTLWDKRLDSVPELVVECLIDNPVEVVSQHAGVFSLGSHGRIGNELHCLARGDDGRALFGRKNVFDQPQVRDDRMFVALRLRSLPQQYGVVFRSEQHSGVKVRRFPQRSRGSFNDSEAIAEVGRTRCEDCLVFNALAYLPGRLTGASQVPGLLQGNRLGAICPVRSGVCRTCHAQNGIQDLDQFVVVSIAADDILAEYLDVDGQSRNNIQSTHPAAECTQCRRLFPDAHLCQQNERILVLAVCECGRYTCSQIGALCKAV